MLNPVKCLAGSIIFITLSNVKQIKSKEYGKYKYNSNNNKININNVNVDNNINCSINALHGREN